MRLVGAYGSVLIDSTMIIDRPDRLMAPERALTPRDGPARRWVNGLVAIALAVCDKYVAAFYEVNQRPQSHVWPPWLDRLEGQVRAGLAALDGSIEGPWCLGERLTQADVTVVATVEAMRLDMAHLAPEGGYPVLDRLCRIAGALPAVRGTRPASS